MDKGAQVAEHLLDVVAGACAAHDLVHLFLDFIDLAGLAAAGVHKSVQALEADIRAWIENWNQDPRPFTWTKTAEEILDSLARYIARISGAGH